MKKLIIACIAVLLLAGFCLPAYAATDSSLDYVTDAVELLSYEEWETLEEKALRLSTLYQCGVYIITVDDYESYTDDTSVYEAAKTIYREYDLGWGEEKSGVLLLLSMAERDYSLIAYGYGNTAFTDYGKDVLADEFLDDFGDDDWYGGFSDYLEQSGDMLKLAKMGKPLDVTSNPLIRFAGIAISILSGVIVSLLICCTLEQKMKSVSIKSGANAYIPAGSVDITLREDRFTHTTERREKIEKSSGGRGGTTIDRDGFSGKSGKF